MLVANFKTEVISNRIKLTFKSDSPNVVNFYKNKISSSTYSTLLIKERTKVVKNKSNSL